MKYKVGDRVKVKSLDWYNKNKSKSHGTVACGGKYFDYDMREWCGKTMTIIAAHKTCYSYIMKEDGRKYFWTDEMIEGLVEEETKSNIIEEAKTYWDSIKDAWICPDGYIFKDENGNIINATKIVLEKKKKEYPKTYEECLNVLGYDDREVYCILHTGADERLFEALYHLKVCRDAYWKLYGEEMGLGRPWEPNYNSLETKYTIEVIENKVVVISTISENHILAFPTEGVRDAFYENFKELINGCKELL